ncbi:RimK family protein [Desulforhopalus sp. IMCC35007]|uniref:RimK family protein n=1 Tax=Desulforhopalus sp. IMCC35007 TaxID=2569543 RepID=UPI0010AEC955|nr:RimK family protein [Desulforhopalus sp. IMCC35007]TKB10730.1 ATP-grasp domain-containing protein [Desulforhopalus sp. IMCC35007]
MLHSDEASPTDTAQQQTAASDNSTNHSVLIVIDSYEQWAPYFTSESVITADAYLQNHSLSKYTPLIINLCSSMSYQSEGYYCSLLAHARKHRALPSIETLNQLDNEMVFTANHPTLRHCGCQSTMIAGLENDGYFLDLFFGKTEDPKMEKFGRAIFEQYPAPLLRVTLSNSQPSQVINIRNLSLDELNDSQQDLFADALDNFSKKVWRRPRSRKSSRYDLAIFHNPEENMPPSDKQALNLFLREAKKMDLNAELITEKDSSRILEFDALFIRQTTSVDNITYRLAQTAEQADMVVIDDPSSIILCTNKVYLKEILDSKSIASPHSKLIFRKNPLSFNELAKELGNTMVLKVPDGSFSVGIDKVGNETVYMEKLETLFKQSSILLAQEFVPTEYDWRIGVLNGEAIFACKYYMAHGHWQIYRHTASGHTRSGKFETMPVHHVPRRITKLAEKVAGSIGKGLYGVDLKESDKGLMVIEINDNPSIDHGVEDKILGSELYRIILREFIKRLDTKRNK